MNLELKWTTEDTMGPCDLCGEKWEKKALLEVTCSHPPVTVQLCPCCYKERELFDRRDFRIWHAMLEIKRLQNRSTKTAEYL